MEAASNIGTPILNADLSDIAGRLLIGIGCFALFGIIMGVREKGWPGFFN